MFTSKKKKAIRSLQASLAILPQAAQQRDEYWWATVRSTVRQYLSPEFTEQIKRATWHLSPMLNVHFSAQEAESFMQQCLREVQTNGVYKPPTHVVWQKALEDRTVRYLVTAVFAAGVTTGYLTKEALNKTALEECRAAHTALKEQYQSLLRLKPPTTEQPAK